MINAGCRLRGICWIGQQHQGRQHQQAAGYEKKKIPWMEVNPGFDSFYHIHFPSR
jgi:hypothetical protein